jgi:hypothetical protein
MKRFGLHSDALCGHIQVSESVYVELPLCASGLGVAQESEAEKTAIWRLIAIISLCVQFAEPCVALISLKEHILMI